MSYNFDNRQVTGVYPRFKVDNNSLGKDLVLYWTLEEHYGIRKDMVSGAHLKTSAGTPSFTASGPLNTSIHFNNSSLEVFNVDFNLLRPDGFVDFTISKWFKVDVDAFGWGLSAYNSSGDNRVWGTGYDNVNNAMKFYAYPSGTSTSVTALDTTTVSLGEWYHVVCWVDTEAREMGISVNNSSPTTSSLSALHSAPGILLTMGRDIGGTGQISGSLSHVGIWNRVLSTTERQLLYNNGVGNPLLR